MAPTALTSSPATNQFGSTLITVSVTDGDGGSNRTSFLLIVNPVNDLPTISAIPDQTNDEDTVVGPLAFTVRDVETPATSLTLSADSSNPSLLPATNIFFGGNGTNRT